MTAHRFRLSPVSRVFSSLIPGVAALLVTGGSASAFDPVDHFSPVNETERVVAVEPKKDLDLPVRWLSENAPIEDAPYAVEIDGTPLPLTVGGKIAPAYYIRFQLEKPVTLDVRASVPSGEKLRLQPRRYESDLTEVADDRFTMQIDRPGPRVLMMEVKRSGGVHTPLIILAETPERWEVAAAEKGFFDVSEFADQGADAPVTAALQKALDACADSGGTVYFGPGEYHTGHLRVGSETRVFLGPGAVIRRHLEPEETDPAKMVLLLFDEATNSELAGPGTIDGTGPAVTSLPAGTERHLVRFRNCRNIRATDVVFRNSMRWTFHITGCEDVEVDGIRIIGDWGVTNIDGIDPDHSRNVRISNVFISASDDAVVVKTTGRYGVTGRSENIEVRDSVVMSKKTALKVGTESNEDISNVRFENIDVIFSSRGLGAWLNDGASYDGITFRDIRVDLYRFEGEEMSGEPFRFTIGNRRGTGTMKNVLLENLDIRAPHRGVFLGRETGRIINTRLRDVDWTVTAKGKGALLKGEWLEGFATENVRVHPEAAKSRGFMDHKNSESVQLDGVTWQDAR